MAISLTYTFVAGTRALASQVNSNFSTLSTRALDKTGDTMTGNLLFTDATYDIGATGATRPRDFFLSRNATIGGTLGVTGAATLSSTLAVTGNSTLASGSGNAAIVGGGATASTLRFLEPSGSGTNYSEFKAQAQAGNVTYTLPAADGTSGYALTTNGSGTLSWSTAGTVSLLKANSGTDTNAAAANVDTIALSGLTAKDRIKVVIAVRSVTQATASLLLYNSTDSVTVVEADGGSAIASGESVTQDAVIQQMQDAATAVAGLSIGRGTATAVRQNITRAAFTQNWTGSWTLALRHGGVTAGGTLEWTWAVYKIAGQ